MRKILLILSVIFLSGCTAYQKARQTKKDNKLVGKVVANQRVFDRVGEMYLSMRPVLPLEPVLIPGKTDTLYKSLPVIDTFYLKEKCKDLSIDSLRKALTSVIHLRTVDTLKVADTSITNRYIRMNDINLQKLYTKEGELLQQQAYISSVEKKLRRAKNNLLIVIIIVAGGILLYVFLKLNPKKLL